MRNLKSKKQWVIDYERAQTLVEDLEVLLEFAKEGDASDQEVAAKHDTALEHIETIEFRNMLSEEGDELSAVLQITAGAGGTESCDWASMLMRMYLMWAEKRGFKVKELNFQEGDFDVTN